MRPVGEARQLAEREGVEIRTYSVIYRAIDELRAAMQGMLEPEEVEDDGRHASRSARRSAPREIGTIAGSLRHRRQGHAAARRCASCATAPSSTTATIDALRRFNDDVREVAAGFECGIVLANFQDVKEGDVLEVYETRQVERELA